MNNQFGLSSLILRMSIVALLLLFISGCANVKTVVRDATDVITTVMLFTDQDDDKMLKQLNTIEENIVDSCQSLFISAGYAVLKEKIPFLVKLGVLFNFRGCQQTISNARQELEMISYVN